MSIDAMKQALAALELLARYENPATKIQVRKPRDGGSIVTMYPHKVASEAATALRAAIEQAQEPVAWRGHVEQRMLTWRQSFVNKSGDQLALDDFMDKRSLDDLIDFVCDEYTAPRQWQGLTEDERARFRQLGFVGVEIVEAALKERNS